MTLDDARLCAEILGGVEPVFAQVTALRRFNDAFPQYRWTYTDGAFGIAVEELSHAGLVPDGAADLPH